MELKQLRCFLVLAEELNFRKASAKLHMTQPPLSRQIKALEEELETQLFIRKTTGVELSNSGLFFLDEAKKVIEQSEQAVVNLNGHINGKSGSLKISFVISGMINFLPQLVKEFKKEYPNVTVELNETSGTSNIIENLLNNKTDVSFTYGVPEHEDTISRVVDKEDVCYVMHDKHRLANEEFISLDMIKKEKFVFFPRELDKEWYDLFINICASADFKPNITQHAHPMQTRLNMVAMGMGLTFAAESLEKLKTPGVVYKRPVEENRIILPVTATFRRTEYNPNVKNFLEISGIKLTQASNVFL